jgi:hypothetical protein
MKQLPVASSRLPVDATFERLLTTEHAEMYDENAELALGNLKFSASSIETLRSLRLNAFELCVTAKTKRRF